MHTCDVVVVGAGAAGLFLAIHAARRGRTVTVLDPGPKPARKVRISGGGRCNFTNLAAAPERYRCGNPHFVKSALARFSPWDMVGFLGKHGLSYEEKDPGQLFCVEGAGAVARALEDAAADEGVRIATDAAVDGVWTDGDHHIARTERGEYKARSLVIATGGPSWPGVGASWFGFDVARQHGLRVEPPRPALVPLVCGQWKHAELSGVSMPVRITSCGEETMGDLLITHRGLSGPAALNISLAWRKGEPLVVDLLPGRHLATLIDDERKESGRTLVRKLLTRHLPARLVERLCGHVGFLHIADLDNDTLKELCGRVHAWEILPTRTEGWEKAEAAAGGVDTALISSKTFEARTVPGLFFVGEVLDVVGELGGYNLHWAWASAFAAAQSV